MESEEWWFDRAVGTRYFYILAHRYYQGTEGKNQKTNVNYIIMPNTSKFDSLHVAHFPKVSVFIFVRFLLLLYLAKSLKTNWSNVVCYFYFQTVGS